MEALKSQRTLISASWTKTINKLLISVTVITLVTIVIVIPTIISQVWLKQIVVASQEHVILALEMVEEKLVKEEASVSKECLKLPMGELERSCVILRIYLWEGLDQRILARLRKSSE